MKVTTKPGNGRKMHIYLDGQYSFTLYDDYWYRLKIPEGAELTEDELAPLKAEAGFRLAYEKGVDYLSRRAYAEKELLRKLKRKYPQEACERAVQRLSLQGYLDDEAYAADTARYLLEQKHFDTRRIIFELRAKGIDADLAAKTAKGLDNQPIQRIIVMLRTKFEGRYADEKEARRLFNRFLRMGYSPSDIRAAFRAAGEQTAALDEDYPEE